MMHCVPWQCTGAWRDIKWTPCPPAKSVWALLLGETEFEVEKCFFGHRSEVEYFGYVVSRDCISLDQKKAAVVQDYPQPIDVKALQYFLGLASYYRCLISNFSKIASLPSCSSMYRYRVHLKPWVWGSISESETTAFPDLACDFILETDTSRGRIRSSLGPKAGGWVSEISCFW